MGCLDPPDCIRRATVCDVKYLACAADYFGAMLAVDAIAHVLAGKKLDAKLGNRITTDRTLADLVSDLADMRAFESDEPLRRSR